MVFCNKEKGGENIDIWDCHNPYFSRWFSAMAKYIRDYGGSNLVTILILVDGFLQCSKQ